MKKAALGILGLMIIGGGIFWAVRYSQSQAAAKPILEKTLAAVKNIKTVRISRTAGNSQIKLVEEWLLPDRQHTQGTYAGEVSETEQIGTDVYIRTQIATQSGQWTEWRRTSENVLQSPFKYLTDFKRASLAGIKWDKGNGYWIINLTGPKMEATNPNYYDDSYSVWISMRDNLPKKATANGNWNGITSQEIEYKDYNSPIKIETPI